MIQYMSTCPGTTFHPQSPNPPNPPNPQSPVSWGAHPFLWSMSALITPNTIGSSQWIIGQASWVEFCLKSMSRRCGIHFGPSHGHAIMETIHFKASLIYETAEQAANVPLCRLVQYSIFPFFCGEVCLLNRMEIQ